MKEDKDNLKGAKSRADRPKRKKLGRANKLTFGNKDPNYVYRVFNDEHGRIKAAQDAWWEIVEDDTQLGDPESGRPSKMDSQVRKNVGGGIQGVLMRLPREIYEADQKEKQQAIDEKEEAIKAYAKSKGHYGEIKIGSTTPPSGPKLGTI